MKLEHKSKVIRKNLAVEIVLLGKTIYPSKSKTIYKI